MSAAASGSRRTLAVSGAALVVVVLGRLYPTSPVLQGALWSCPLKTISGLPCPACGSTRVAVHLAHGRLVEAFALAPLPALLLVGGLALGVLALGRRLRGGEGFDHTLASWLRRRRAQLALAVLAALLYGYALARAVAG